ncbi:decreased expression in renal and prostate cancer protein-like [Eupeodes corollae]|uniref:decreased expression in renal and prostate cancer protein-like n=1 Tax=Eupeodes corollae TaxID=290404 RepID=UPI002493032B|nr:decreased expression in renal and prostate cancer protein-like [Eupeodes corollae]
MNIAFPLVSICELNLHINRRSIFPQEYRSVDSVRGLSCAIFSTNLVMKVNIVLSVVAIFCTFAASENAARNTRQAGRFGPSYGGSSGPNYGPGPGPSSRPGSNQNPSLGPSNRPTLTSGYSFGGPGPGIGGPGGPGGPSGRPLSGSIYGVSSGSGRPSLQGGPGPRPGSVYRGQPVVSSGGRPVNSYKG